MERKSVALFVLLLVVLASEVPNAEARVCESKSHHYRGMCFRDHNCAMVCRTEGGFSGGICRGFRRRCICTRRC